MSSVRANRHIVRALMRGTVVAAVIAVPLVGCQAQVALAPSLSGRHTISMQAGLLSRGDGGVSARLGSVSADAGATGFLGALSYSYGVDSDWTVGVTAGAVAAVAFTDITIGGVDARAATVTAVLLGASWYQSSLALGRSLRPYVSLAAGPYRRSVGGTTTSVGRFVTDYRSSTAAGFRLAGGMDLFVGRRFRTGVSAGYHVVANFTPQEGLMRNASGPELSLGFGVLLGTGRR